ncbi:C2H2-type domain-containing protein [Aphelenchoides bicaudatus]|nr:C2H2-type domain-containing protein [Aphelenchoides bicaudatus]
MMDVEEDLFAGFDLEEMRALEDGDLSLFSNLIDPNFRLGSGSGGSDSNPSPTSLTPTSEELALVLQMDEEDPKLLSSKFLAFKSPDAPTAANNGQFQVPNDTAFFHNNNNQIKSNRNEKRPEAELKPSDDTPAPPPLVVCPIEVSKASITLQKNQLCACKECGKLFKSIWYLKQHAVRHSNERPFKCNFCQKASFKRVFKLN